LNGTSPRFLRIIPLGIVLLTVLARPAFSEDIKTLTEKAKVGDPEAQFTLGVSYAAGHGVPKDLSEAVKWWVMAAAHGSTEAQDILETMYVRQFKDPGVPRDYSEAMKWLVKAAEQGSPGAQDLLGWMYCKGQGVPEDYAEAAKWFRKAAEQGYAAAQRDLAILYFRGEGVPQDFAEAAKWTRKAAEQGYAPAQRDLGVLYAEGKGVSQDNVQSYFWYSMAASRPEEKEHRLYLIGKDRAAKKLTPEQLEKTQDMIREWEEKHRGSEYPHLSSAHVRIKKGLGRFGQVTSPQ